MSFRPSRWTLFRFLIVPTIVPGILTAWKVNLGNAPRASWWWPNWSAPPAASANQLLRQAAVVRHGRRHGLDAANWCCSCWLVQQTINAIEAYALRYRAVSERAM